MGNTHSIHTININKKKEEDIWWTNGEKSSTILNQKNLNHIDNFDLKLIEIREKRNRIIGEKRKEMQDLRDDNIKLKNENEQLKKQLNNMNEDFKHFQDLSQKNRDLRLTIIKIQQELQQLNDEIMNFEKERQDYKAHVIALKDVIKVSKQMLMIREGQLNELKQKVSEIETTIAGKEIEDFSKNLKVQYEKQLENIRNLRIFYDERQKADEKEKEKLKDVIDETKKIIYYEQKKNQELKENINHLEEDNSKKYDEIKNLESELGLSKAETRQFQAELTVINQLFSEILLGVNNSPELDVNKLVEYLEENHDLLTNIIKNEESSAVSYVLPKVLWDLVNEINNEKSEYKEKKEKFPENKLETIIEENETQNASLYQFNSAEEIVKNLPKVWKILIELLSHQSTQRNSSENDLKKGENPCYKLVETPKGPSLVLSVSKTFIRLKNLILEKKSLEKDSLHLKQLNTHLELRLQEQENRLEIVTKELSKTWQIVGKLQKQHQLLHTQEKILRYELSQKRKLLTQLKVELEYSREKWMQAREKNSNTEKEWKELRTEFALRKNHTNDESNNSIESGYSDERECLSSDDEHGYDSYVTNCNGKEENKQNIQNKHIDINQDIIINNENELSNIVYDDSISITDDSSVLKLIDDNDEQNKRQYDDNLTESCQINSINDELKTDDLEQNYKKTEENTPSTSSADKNNNNNLEDIFKTREERLKKLEGLATNLVKQVTNTSNKSIQICNKLENLHEIFGEVSNSVKLENNNDNDSDDDN